MAYLNVFSWSSTADEGRTRAIARLRKLAVRYEGKGNVERATALRQRAAVLVAAGHRRDVVTLKK
jgi:hypothetical protein